MTDTPELEYRGRGLMLGGAKAFVKLDAASWRAIEILAQREGIEWSDWVRSAWSKATASISREKWEEINRAGALRATAIAQLLEWVEAQSAMLKHYEDLAGVSNRVEIKIGDGVGLVLDPDQATAIAERITKSHQRQNVATGEQGEKQKVKVLRGAVEVKPKK